VWWWWKRYIGDSGDSDGSAYDDINGGAYVGDLVVMVVALDTS
jgi:hypothetical protein